MMAGDDPVCRTTGCTGAWTDDDEEEDDGDGEDCIALWFPVTMWDLVTRGTLTVGVVTEGLLPLIPADRTGLLTLPFGREGAATSGS